MKANGTREGTRTIRIKASEVPKAKPPEREREGILLPWVLASVGAVPLLLLWLWVLVRWFGVVPFEWYGPIADLIGLAALLSVAAGCFVAFFRWLAGRKRDRGEAEREE